MATQVAGHTFQNDSDALGLLQDPTTACVLKPLGKPACGERELCFYETLQNTKDPLLAEAKSFVPKYHNKLKLFVNNREHMFLKLEDLTHGMLKPCIMDVKIGKRTWDPLASPQKRTVEEKKYAGSKPFLGLCVPGFQVYKSEGGGSGGDAIVKRYNKEYGKQLDVNGFRATIALFLNSCVPLGYEILKQLYAIRDWFKRQTLFHFYASSLLIVYDFASIQPNLRSSLSPSASISDAMNGQLTNGNTQNDYTTLNSSSVSSQTPALDPSLWVKVKMIDFAHVFPAENDSLDTNYIFGLQNLITVIEELLVR